MNDKQKSAEQLSKISGEILNYRAIRTNANFFFADSDRAVFGIIAIASGIAGLSGPAASVASYSRDTEETADYLEFSLSGNPVRGWVWRSPFANGDIVDVVGSWRGGQFELVGIRREKDRTIALYPHCSRGRLKHWKTSLSWWGIGTTLFMGSFFLSVLLIGGVDGFFGSWEEGASYVYAAVCILFALTAFGMNKKWMPFVRLAEKIFEVLDLPNPGAVDLVKSSRRQRTKNDSGEFGTFYFRY